MGKIRSCPICDSLNSRLIKQINLLNFDRAKFSLSVRVSECLNCGFIFNNEIDVESLEKFYRKGNYYFTESSFGTGGRDINRYEIYVKCFMRYLNRKSIIVDVGCGKGQLLKYLIDKGFTNARGVEFDKRMVEIATQQDIPVQEGASQRLPLEANSVDFLIYTHVFEHLWDLDHDIEQARICLKQNGLIFIEVPNASNYAQARVFDYFWLSLPEHINHFSDYYLEMLMNKHGFERITSMQTVVPYNNPAYGYPSLRMIFQKKENILGVFRKIEYSVVLKNRIKAYILSENEHMLKHKQMINKLKTSEADVYVWGIGIEFFILTTYTNLLECNILAFIDKNPDKQRMTIHSKSIVSPESLKQVTSDSVILLTSVFNKTQMQKYLHEISFDGQIINID